MSRHSRIPLPHSSGTLDEKIRPPSDEIQPNGHIPKRPNDMIPKHRRVISDISLRKNQEPIPELFLGAPLQDDFNERRTLQTQWAEALKKVQALGSHSNRWSGVATDLSRPPKSMPSQASTRSTLEQWNYYPGPSVNREKPKKAAGTDRTWKPQGKAQFSRNNSVTTPLENLDPDETRKSQAGEADFSSSKGCRSRSSGVTTRLENLDPAQTWKAQVGEAPDETWKSQAGEANFSSSSNLMRGCRSRSVSGVTARVENLDPDRTWKSQVAEAPERVHRTQSQRYGGMKVVPDARVLNKAVSMREGGAHADAVLEMARAYTPDTVCGVPLTLQCASCGRSLGVIVQGNPGVDIAFCQACRPSEVQWRSGGSGKKKKSGIVRFCRRILRLDRKTS